MRLAIVALPLFALLGACKGNTVSDTTDTDIGSGDDTDTNGGDDTDTNGGDDTDSGVDCTAAVASISPADGTPDASVDSAVTVTFTAAVTADQFALSITGVPGAASLAGDGMSATFTPSASLSYDTDYVVDVSVCDVASTASFHTATAPLDPTDLAGRTYAIDYKNDVTWKEPKSSSYFSDQINIEYMLVQVMAVDLGAQTIDMSSGIGDTASSGDIEQTACYTTVTFDQADFSTNPKFSAGPKDMTIPSAYGDVTIEDFAVSGTFSADGSEIDGIDMTGNIDTRPLDTAMGMDVCKTVSYFGDKCVACRDGETKCLPAWMQADKAVYVPGLDIDESYDPSADPSCN